MLLVWVVLTMTLCTGKCAGVDYSGLGHPFSRFSAGVWYPTARRSTERLANLLSLDDSNAFNNSGVGSIAGGSGGVGAMYTSFGRSGGGSGSLIPVSISRRICSSAALTSAGVIGNTFHCRTAFSRLIETIVWLPRSGISKPGRQHDGGSPKRL
jgi:hypothetical protein